MLLYEKTLKKQKVHSQWSRNSARNNANSVEMLVLILVSGAHSHTDS